jgi:hypothetical protein
MRPLSAGSAPRASAPAGLIGSPQPRLSPVAAPLPQTLAVASAALRAAAKDDPVKVAGVVASIYDGREPSRGDVSVPAQPERGSSSDERKPELRASIAQGASRSTVKAAPAPTESVESVYTRLKREAAVARRKTIYSGLFLAAALTLADLHPHPAAVLLTAITVTPVWIIFVRGVRRLALWDYNRFHLVSRFMGRSDASAAEFEAAEENLARRTEQAEFFREIAPGVERLAVGLDHYGLSGQKKKMEYLAGLMALIQAGERETWTIRGLAYHVRASVDLPASAYRESLWADASLTPRQTLSRDAALSELLIPIERRAENDWSYGTELSFLEKQAGLVIDGNGGARRAELLALRAEELAAEFDDPELSLSMKELAATARRAARVPAHMAADRALIGKNFPGDLRRARRAWKAADEESVEYVDEE